MGMFDDICMVTDLPIFQAPVVVCLVCREQKGAPWRLLGGPIAGTRDAYGQLADLPNGPPEQWLAAEIVRTLSGVQPQYRYGDSWSIPDATPEGLSSFVDFMLRATRDAQRGSEPIFPASRYGDVACAEMFASVYEAILAETPLVDVTKTGVPELVPPMKATDVSRLSRWLIESHIAWKPLISAQTSEEDQVQAFLRARDRWSKSKLITEVVERFLDNHEWAWERGYR